MKIDSRRHSLDELTSFAEFLPDSIDISQFEISRAKHVIKARDALSNAFYVYEFTNTNHTMTLRLDDHVLAKVSSKLWASFYKIQTPTNCLGKLNHQNNTLRHRFYGQFATTDGKRMDVFVSCHHNYTNILTEVNQKRKLVGRVEQIRHGIFEEVSYKMTVAKSFDIQFALLLWLIASEDSSIQKSISQNSCCALQ